MRFNKRSLFPFCAALLFVPITSAIAKPTRAINPARKSVKVEYVLIMTSASATETKVTLDKQLLDLARARAEARGQHISGIFERMTLTTVANETGALKGRRLDIKHTARLRPSAVDLMVELDPRGPNKLQTRISAPLGRWQIIGDSDLESDLDAHRGSLLYAVRVMPGT